MELVIEPFRIEVRPQALGLRIIVRSGIPEIDASLPTCVAVALADRIRTVATELERAMAGMERGKAYRWTDDERAVEV